MGNGKGDYLNDVLRGVDVRIGRVK